MKLENVSNIEIAPDDSLLVVGLEGGDSPSYQYVYRAAAGVYWANAAGAFMLDMKTNVPNDVRSEIELSYGRL